MCNSPGLECPIRTLSGRQKGALSVLPYRKSDTIRSIFQRHKGMRNKKGWKMSLAFLIYLTEWIE